MKKWYTFFDAIDVKTGHMQTWHGEIVEASTRELAQQWCYENRGHLRVIGELIAEIPCKAGTTYADFKKRIDYDMQSDVNANTVQDAQNDMKRLEVEILRLIAEFQKKHPGLMIESIGISQTKVIGYPPIQRVEAEIKLTN